MANLEYLAVDSLNMNLKKNHEKIWGSGRKSFLFKPWNIDLCLHAKSDVLSKNECGLWVSLTRRIWLYLTVTKKSIKLVVFDGKEYGITLEQTKEFGGRSIDDTLSSLGPFIKERFVFHDEKGWVREDRREV